MRSLTIWIVVACGHAKKRVANSNVDAQDVVDRFTDKLADKLADRAVKAWQKYMQSPDLDSATLKKMHADSTYSSAYARPVFQVQSRFPFPAPRAPSPVSRSSEPPFLRKSRQDGQQRSHFPVRDISTSVGQQWPDMQQEWPEKAQREAEPSADATESTAWAEEAVPTAEAAAEVGEGVDVSGSKFKLPTTRRALGAAAVAAAAAIKFNEENLKSWAMRKKVPHPHTEICKIMCQGDVMCEINCEIQTLHGSLFADSKYFVDMPLLSDPKEMLAAFEALPRNQNGAFLDKELDHFLREKFGAAGADLEDIDPEDWQASPAFLAELGDGHREWATDVHSLWKGLVRRPVQDVLDNPQRHTLLWTPHPIVVPGGRFRESYYWDSFWIVQGLIVSGMNVTARGVVENLLSFVERFGFVPNGGRSYYLHRSQPPMLSEMVLALVDDLNKRGQSADAQSFIRRSLPVLEREHQFWQENRTAKLGDDLFLSHYDCGSNLPRLESFREDVDLLRLAKPAREPASLFRAVGAGAESGWDFSSRWLADGQSLSSIDTTEVFPVDLNAILLRMELNLRTMHLALGNATGADIFGSFAKSRFTAMNRFMWSDADGSWRDISRELTPRTNDGVDLASDFVPLWSLARIEDARFLGANATQSAMAVAELDRSGLIRPGGVVTTSVLTGQQWDSPNAWAPLQQMLIEGLVGGLARDQGGEALGKKIANTWVETNLLAWQKSRLMFEKYDADVMGEGGAGGEYIPQTGFGWTNGVALQLLSQFFRQPASNMRLATP